MTSPSTSLLFEHENYSQLRKKRNEKDSQWQILQYQPQAWSSVSYLQSWGLNCSYALDLSRAAVRKLPAWFVGFAATLVCEKINLTFTRCISQKFQICAVMLSSTELWTRLHIYWLVAPLHVCRFTEMLKQNFAFRLEIKTFKCLLLSDVTTSGHESLFAFVYVWANPQQGRLTV